MVQATLRRFREIRSFILAGKGTFNELIRKRIYPNPLSTLFQHEVSGQTLLRITDNTLLRMGIKDDQDREAIMREIGKQRLKTDIVDFRDLESKNGHYDVL